ncbi:MAG: hypothetical protein IT198_05930 [Acidimicrobiia bacterium]|nr:hypothetical protein [Acidimicrobiia bacterium]
MTSTRPHLTLAAEGPHVRTVEVGFDVETPHRRAGLSDDDALEMYQMMLLARRLDERIWTLQRQGKAPFAVSCQGHEGAQVGMTWAMDSDDVLCPYYRDLAAVLVRGLSPTDVLLGVLARSSDPCSGAKQMPNHWGSRVRGIITGSSPIATQLPHAVGIAYARKLRGMPGVVVTSFGDGATAEGDFHEALNFAGIHRLPVVFVCQNNGYAISVPLAKESAVADVALRASGYAMPGVIVDGQNVTDVYTVCRDAIARAREGGGPTLVEAKTYRYLAHTSDDNDRTYRTAEEVEAWRKKDPIQRLNQDLIESRVLPHELEREIEDSVEADVALAVTEAEAAPEPTPREAYTHVFAAPVQAVPARERARPPVGRGDGGEEVNLITAIHDTLEALVADDERVVVLGEDVGPRGGVFGVTKGLDEHYGDSRILDTPLAESLIVGAAIGMALDGMRPVAEIQFLDFIHPAIDQILNEAAKIHYRSNGDFTCPLVIRVPYGGGVHGALYHSQSIEALFCHVPGLKVVAPCTPADAAGLLRAAVADPDPVLFLEHKKAYRAVRGVVPEGDRVVPIGVGEIVRAGTDVTIATYGMMRHHSEAAAATLAGEGVDCEIVDLRTLYPLDYDLVCASVERTGRLLVVHEANRTGGIGAELGAEVAERSFWGLDAPVRRLGLADVPALPYAPALEAEVLFGADRIADAVRALVAS